MSATATYLALGKSEASNALVGVLTFYLVATAWLTVKRKQRDTSLLDSGLTLMALVTGFSALVFGWKVANSATGLDDEGIPAVAFFVLGCLALLAAGLDVRMFARVRLASAPRIARHLWRMCFALLITTVSFFNGARSKVLPEMIRDTPLHDVPVIVVAISLIFWLSRVLFTNAYKHPRTKRRDSSTSREPDPASKV
jgi:peptidoglycan/LPS O-acetylase OafA/YrhL